MKHGIIVLSVMVAFAAQTFAWVSPSELAGALDTVQSSDPAVMAKSVGTIRNAGPAGLNALLARYDISNDPKLIPIIDAVAAQHDAIYSRLYWYTDFYQAKAAAQSEHKPILCLRLLGKLTDEYSCANSRFFRTVLYANANVSKLLRDQFVLVWQSERPVPVVTIDYGDGRVLKRTLTGNSIHYVLDQEGNIVDALPGLYDPETFANILRGAQYANSSRGGRLGYIGRTEDNLLRQWQMDMAQVNPKQIANIVPAVKPDGPNAMVRTMSKRAVETPLLAQTDPQFARDLAKLADSADAATWEKVAELHQNGFHLDASSIALIRNQNPSAYADKSRLGRTVAQFETLIEQDTVRNNFVFRRQILDLLRMKGSISLEDLNKWVYNDLFLTPRSDQWLGLVSQNTYSALNNDGICAAPAGPANVAER